MSPIATVNPATNEVVQEFKPYTTDQVESIVQSVHQKYQSWRTTTFQERGLVLRQVADLLRKDKDRLGALITLEMGKPILQSVAEVEKCAMTCEFYLEQAEGFLSNENIVTEAKKSFIGYDPLGVVLAIMPWNFPFWQVIRFAAPAIMAGNTCLLKHASNVPQCALAIQDLFDRAGAPGLFGTLLIESGPVKELIGDDRVAAVTLTGSEHAGSQVAAEAGRHIKKLVLELGGSDPFIVLKDADLVKAVRIAVKSRMNNTGQSCIAAKRFIVVEEIADEFAAQLNKAMQELQIGDPAEKETQVGPLAREDLAEELMGQIERSVVDGAEIALGGERADRSGAFVLPTILDRVTISMTAHREELFGPVAAIIRVANEEDAIQVANDSPYGLGASIWTTDLERGERLARRIESGSVFINGLVQSDPRLPFGGIKKSGYGRELSYLGIREFCNIKTIVIND
jgi:succinate-semialdehyde dehydrogenase/glutarate-semialdehyde dehydrogenase